MDSNGDGVGDIQGIISKLEYLKNLGIDVIWLNPVYTSPNDDNGYDISDYRNIMDDFGSMADFDELLQGVHSLGMRLIMDLVVNHTSDEHAWFRESRSSTDNPKRDYYIWRSGNEGNPPNNWGSFFEGPAWDLDDVTGEWYLHLFTRKQPDLNWENPEVRREVREIIRFWMDKGVDGFRMDVINLISKRPGLPDGTDPENIRGHENFANGPRIDEYLAWVQESISGYDAMTVGETVIADLDTVARYVDEEQGFLNMAINFEHVSVDRRLGPFDAIPLNIRKLKSCLSSWQTRLDGRGWNCLYMSNHDQPRQVSRFGNDSLFHRESATLLATLLHTLQGTPFIMQGEELGMTNIAFPSIDDYRDVATLNYFRQQTGAGESPSTVLQRIHRCSRDNARTPMQWNNSENAGFSRSTPWIGVNPNYRHINAEAQLKDTDSVLSYYRELIRLRKENPVFIYGNFSELDPEHESVYAYNRSLGLTGLTVVLNMGDTGVDYQLPAASPAPRVLCGNYSNPPEYSNRITLRPWEAAVWLKDTVSSKT